jgi:hypothetical protein
MVDRPQRTSVLAGEPALERRISLSERESYLGELLDRLTAETGVSLEASDRVAPISGYSLSVVVRNLPARDLLEELPVLFGFGRDRWFWERRRRDGPDGFLLRNTLPGGALQQARTAFDEQFILDQRRRLQAFWSLPPERRAAVAASDAFLKAGNDLRNRMFFSFIERLPEEAIVAIARGGKLDIPTDRLSPAQREFIRDEFRRANILGRPGIEQPDEMRKVTLHDSEGTVMLQVGRVGSHGVLGGIWLTAAK